MSSKIKVDTIENVAGSGNVSLGSGHNLVVPGDLTVDTTTLHVDSSNNKVGIGTTSPAETLEVVHATAPAIQLNRTNDGGFKSIIRQQGNDTEFRGSSGSTKIYTGAADGDSSTARLLIDASGRVTMPTQPSFQAKGGNDNYISTSPIPFPTVSGSGIAAGAHNIGGHYNASNYTFTAPVAGRYIFHVHLGIIRQSQNGTQAYPTLLINGSGAAYSYTKLEVTPSANNYLTAHITQVVNLAANDAVKVNFNQSSGGTYYNGTSESSFMGYLLG